MADAFDHRGVVLFIRQDHGIRDARAKGGKGGPVRHIAGGKKKRRLLPMQPGQFLFQQEVVVVRARDVARAACTGAAGLHGLDHRLHHGFVLAHAQIIVRTPDGDLAHRAVLVIGGPGKGTAAPLQIGEDTIVALRLQRVDLSLKNCVEVHVVTSSLSVAFRVLPCPMRLLVSGRRGRMASSSARASGREGAGP